MRDNFCTCSNTNAVPTRSLFITITRSATRIQLFQPQDGVHSFSDFEYVLRNIRFAHDVERPVPDITEYEAYVRVSASDGQLSSEVAVSQIVVGISNTPPMVMFGNDTTTEVVMRDGEPVIPVLQVGADIVEDSETISRVTLTLTNAVHETERLYAIRGNVSSSITITNDSSSVTLQGPASLVEFIDALHNIEVYYSYPPMESILQGDVPDFTPRLVYKLLIDLVVNRKCML